MSNVDIKNHLTERLVKRYLWQMKMMACGFFRKNSKKTNYLNKLLSILWNLIYKHKRSMN